MDPISKALRALLDERGMTDTQLMAASGLSPATVSHYLSGKRGVRINSQSLKTFLAIAAALGVPPEFFREYRLFQIEEALRDPELEERFYRQIMAFSAVQQQRLEKNPKSVSRGEKSSTEHRVDVTHDPGSNS